MRKIDRTMNNNVECHKNNHENGVEIELREETSSTAKSILFNVPLNEEGGCAFKQLGFRFHGPRKRTGQVF